MLLATLTHRCRVPDHSFFLQMSARPRFQALGRACLGEAIAQSSGTGSETEGSLALFNKTAESVHDNLICMWVQEPRR